MSGFLETFGRTFSDVLSPLRYSIDSAEELELFLLSHGWDAHVDPADEQQIQAAFAIIELLQAVVDKLDVLVNGTDEQRSQAIKDLVEATIKVVDRLDGLKNTAGVGLPSPFDQAAFWNDIALELLDELTISYLERRQPFFFSFLHIFGVIRYERVTPVSAGRVPYIRKKLYWDRLPRIATEPATLFKDVYKWDTPGADFEHQEFVRAVERAATAFNIHAAAGPPRPALSAMLDPAVVTQRGVREVEIPIVDGISTADDAYWKIGAVIVPIPDPIAGNTAPRGLLVSPLMAGLLSLEFPFSQDISLKLSGAFESGAGIKALIYPDRASVQANITEASFAASATLLGQPAEPWLIIGERAAARLEMDGFLAEFGAQGQIADPEIFFSVGTGQETNKVRLVVKAGEGDGFVQKLIGEGFELEFGANLHWSSKNGMSFDGSAALEFQKTIHLALGPVTIETIYVQARLGTGGKLDIGFGAGIKGELGPITVIIENIGLEVSLVPAGAGKRGAFGGMDVALGFKPPNGVGLVIDAGTVKGGGYLYFDFDKEEYAGALELTIAGWLSLKAIGLVTTRMPDGSKGFSLLIIITAEFGSGIQIGMGFTLLGVGGLLGLNRQMLLQPLLDGVRNGAVNNIMFPTDVIKNAPRIISDLRTIFPPKEGVFLIGPMAKIGYGTPPLITLSVGIIIEIPGNIAILGVLKCLLPQNAQDEESRVLVLQIAFVGALEFDKKRFWFFAALYESRLLRFTLEGEMGILCAWGDDANFVLSVGGFHPRFKAPPLPFPVPKRLAISILDRDNARIRCETYFAITSNTVQFGVRAEMFIGFDDLKLDGHFAFDTLFQFSPFFFAIELSASLSMKVFGVGVFSVRIELLLEGPTPWHAKGYGKIELLFFSVSARFDKTWGNEDGTILPPIEVMPKLLEQINLPENWVAVLPKGATQPVSTRKLDAQRDGLVMHPMGVLRVSQRFAPLNSTLDLIGAQKPSDVKRVSLALTNAAADGLTSKVRNEMFAPAQFHEMSKTEKVAADAFEPEQGGIDISAVAELASAHSVKRVLRYEQIIIDTNFRRHESSMHTVPSGIFQMGLRGNSAARNALSWQTQMQKQPFEDVIGVHHERYGVARVSDNRLVRNDALVDSRTAAQQLMEAILRAAPQLQGTLHVLPESELNLPVAA